MILYVVLISVVLLVATQLLGEASPKDELTTQDIFGYFERGEVKSFELDQDANLEIILNDEKGTEISARLLDYELFRDKIFIPFILDNPENTVEYNLKEPTQIPWWVEFLPYVVIYDESGNGQRRKDELLWQSQSQALHRRQGEGTLL